MSTRCDQDGREWEVFVSRIGFCFALLALCFWSRMILGLFIYSTQTFEDSIHGSLFSRKITSPVTVTSDQTSLVVERVV